MAGLYIHIPFCKQACSYCNFHFSTSLKLKEPLLHALHLELDKRAAELHDQELKSVYFGGGTPSLLEPGELLALWTHINQSYHVSPSAEVTLEANPDDLSLTRLQALHETPINRLSIGIQSFFDEDLQFMRRAHTATDALRTLEILRSLGWNNITIDLIYGTPTLTADHWQANLQFVLDFEIAHLSAYQLTVEPRTILAAQVRKGLVKPTDDSTVLGQFEVLMDWAEAHDYAHYEISNFARPGHRAVHNSSYWSRTDYLGIGPSAHSLTGNKRQWNIANNARYIKSLAHGLAIEASEELAPHDIYNEMVMTGLRTAEGVVAAEIQALGSSFWEHFAQCVQPFIEQSLVAIRDEHYALTRAGKNLADHIAANCFADADSTR